MKPIYLLLLLASPLWAQSTFGGYTGANCGSNPVCTLTIKSNTNVQAAFTGAGGSIAQFTANNTSACSTQAYCSGPFKGMANNSDVGAQTVTVNSVPGNVSTVDIHNLLPAGTKVLVHSTDWFTQGTTGDHIQTHYNSNDVNTVHAQDNYQIALHIDGRVIDWYSQFNATVDGATQKIRDDLAARCGGPQNCPEEFAIVEDQSAITHAQGSRAACAITDATCMQTSLMQDMCYINATYANSNAYIKLNPGTNAWAASTNALVGFFPPSSTSAWNTAVSNVKAIVNVSGWATSNCPSGQQQNNGAFRTYDSNTTNVAETQYNGGSSWVGTSAWSTTNQLLIDGPSGNYHESLYQSCNANPGQVCIGSAKKGFNDFPSPPFASWGTNRVTAQECGQTWAQTLAKASTFTGSNLMVEIPTWNDYEEGSEIETGIDNCGTMNAPTLSGNILLWSMTTRDATYAPLTNGLVSNGTIDHFAVIRCSINDTSCVDISDQAPSVHGLDLTLVSIPTGSWHIWVEAVGINSVINRMSPSAVTFTH